MASNLKTKAERGQPKNMFHQLSLATNLCNDVEKQ